jgi:hypothetical protein
LPELGKRRGRGIRVAGAIGTDKHENLSQQQTEGSRRTSHRRPGGPPRREETPAIHTTRYED